MILFELTQTEGHLAYVTLEISNGERQYDFLRSVVLAAISLNKTFLSQDVLRALNFHAIACLHTNAGEYRPCPVKVGDYQPPEHYRVQALMDDFVNEVNRNWDGLDAVVLACYVLWRLNHIHPFINGNGRTARAACYFVLCLKAGGLLRGALILPELLRRNRDDYVAALKAADASFMAGAIDLSELHVLVSTLLQQQIEGADSAAIIPDPQSGEAPT